MMFQTLYKYLIETCFLYLFNKYLSAKSTKKSTFEDRTPEHHAANTHHKEWIANGFRNHINKSIIGFSIERSISHINAMKLDYFPFVDKKIKKRIKETIFANFLNLDAYSLHHMMTRKIIPQIKSIIYHENISNDEYIFGFHATPYTKGLAAGIDFERCQARDSGYWGKGFYLALYMSQVMYYMISYEDLCKNGLSNGDKGYIFMYGAKKTGLIGAKIGPGKTVGTNIPDGIDYQLSEMGSEAVFSRQGISKLVLVATIEIEICGIPANTNLAKLIKNTSDYFNGARLETPRY